MTEQLNVAIVGHGAIGRDIARALTQAEAPNVRLRALCARPSALAEARALYPDILVTDQVAEATAAADLVIEAAGHALVREDGEQILGAGRDFYVLSVGALADDDLRGRLEAASRRGGGRIIVPAGALAGFDGVQSMRASGLSSLTYISVKPPVAWRGTAAEEMCDLDALTEPRTFFFGTAREAATRFPKNANLAAAVAFAGLGLDRTRVELKADPAATGNHGRVIAESPTALLDLTLSGPGSSNPKTSAITANSVVAALANRTAAIHFA